MTIEITVRNEEPRFKLICDYCKSLFGCKLSDTFYPTESGWVLHREIRCPVCSTPNFHDEGNKVKP